MQSVGSAFAVGVIDPSRVFTEGPKVVLSPSRPARCAVCVRGDDVKVAVIAVQAMYIPYE